MTNRIRPGRDEPIKPTTKVITEKQHHANQRALAHHTGFLAACSALKQVFAGAEHKDIRAIIDAIDHVQGDPATVRRLRRELRAKARASLNPVT